MRHFVFEPSPSSWCGISIFSFKRCSVSATLEMTKRYTHFGMETKREPLKKIVPDIGS